MMEEEEYQQEAEGGEMGMEDGAQASGGIPIAALEVCTRTADRWASVTQRDAFCARLDRARTASPRPT
jgi:hypothetical protein